MCSEAEILPLGSGTLTSLPSRGSPRKPSEIPPSAVRRAPDLYKLCSAKQAKDRLGLELQTQAKQVAGRKLEVCFLASEYTRWKERAREERERRKESEREREEDGERGRDRGEWMSEEWFLEAGRSQETVGGDSHLIWEIEWPQSISGLWLCLDPPHSFTANSQSVSWGRGKLAYVDSWPTFPLPEVWKLKCSILNT